jgi:hypothetical protein
MTTREVPARGRRAATPAEPAVAVTTRGRGPGLLARRPDILPMGATAAAWSALAILTPYPAWLGLSAAPTAISQHGAHGGMFTPTGMAMIALMSLAMMGPLAIPGVRYVAANSLWWRAGTATWWFFGTFIATWTVIAACLQPFAELLAGVVGSASKAAGLLTLACAIAQLDRRRAVRSSACDSPMRLRARGSDAYTDCARFGLLCGARGFRLCALPMLAMLAVPTNLLVMALLTAFTVADRVTQGRRRLLIAALYTGLGALLLLLT